MVESSSSVSVSLWPPSGPLNWNRKFINKLCLLLINQSEVLHCTAAAGGLAWIWVCSWGFRSLFSSPALGCFWMCPATWCNRRQSWHVAHVGWQGHLYSYIRVLFPHLVWDCLKFTMFAYGAQEKMHENNLRLKQVTDFFKNMALNIVYRT